MNHIFLAVYQFYDGCFFSLVGKDSLIKSVNGRLLYFEYHKQVVLLIALIFVLFVN
jgi:hypothetical protein